MKMPGACFRTLGRSADILVRSNFRRLLSRENGWLRVRLVVAADRNDRAPILSKQELTESQ